MKIISLILLFSLTTIVAQAQTIKKWKIEDLVAYIDRSEKPTMVNFWATYCVPCIEEIPYFQELTKKYKANGVELLLVSLDFAELYPARIAAFAKKRKFYAPIVWLDEENADHFCPKIDSSWSGVMPATLFVNNKTGFRSFYEEQIPKETLELEIRKMINLK